MPIYKFKCYKCEEDFEKIVKINQKFSHCPKCDNLGERVHGQDLPSPPLIDAGIGGVHKPRFGERKYE